MPERFGERTIECVPAGFPAVSLYSHFRPLDTQHIEGVQFTAPARRQGSRLDDQRGMPGDSVPFCCVADMADVQVSGKEQVGSYVGEPSHRHAGAADEMPGIEADRKIEWMVGDDHLDETRRKRTQPVDGRLDLRSIQTPLSSGDEPSRAVQSDDRHFIVYERRLQVRPDDAAVPAKWIEDACREIEQRNVVIARNHDAGERQPIEKGAGLAELTAPRPLRQVAGHGDEIRFERGDALDERRDNGFVNAAEVQIRQMNEGSHRLIIVLVATTFPTTDRLPPGPNGSLLLGSLREIWRDPLSFLLHARDKYGDVVRFRIAHRAIFLLNDPGDSESVLVTHQKRFVKGRTLDRARRLFGNGLLTSDGAFHASQRRQILPSFHRSHIAEYGEIMSRIAASHRERWHAGQVIDIAAAMNRLTLAIAGRSLFAADLEALADDLEEAQAAAIGRLEMAVMPFTRLVDRLPLPRVRRFQAARARLDRALYELIDRRRRDCNGHGDVLSQWLRAQQASGTGGMSDTQIRDEMMTLLLGGYETTANALAWTWYLLAQHPGVETRLHAELDSVLGSRVAAAEDVGRLPFTRMVLAESMRLYPPAWLIGRVAAEDHAAAGYRVRAGSVVIMSPWAVHRDARYFPAPETFDPDRWSADRQAARPKFSYFPFGGGSRGCIGEPFALMEGVLVLASLAQRWKFRLIGDRPRIYPAITLRPSPGIQVIVEPRS